jgi:D-3-phosphoglycerate dehydrogenase / 2-oxoglutarate reductase
MNIYVTEKNEINQKGLDLLTKNGHSLIFSQPEDTSSIEALFIRTYTKVDSAYLTQFSHLNYIIRAGVGLENVDLAACKEKNITIINAPGSNANAVAEFVIGLMTMLLRQIPYHIKQLQTHKWRDMQAAGAEIKGKTIGLVGCGAIGKLIAKKLQSFDIQDIVGYDPYLDAPTLEQFHIKKVELDNLLKKSDIVSLHLPLTPETKHLITLEKLKIMKPTSFIINTSRGGIIHEQDLIKALQTHIIKGAALDVFENEPDINKTLLTCDNLIATPHIAALTQEADVEMSVQAVKHFLKVLDSHN